jgi:transposase
LNRKVYDREFKLNAIKLSEESKMKSREFEKELGIGAGCLSHWKKEFKTEKMNAFPGNGNPKEKEIYELKKKIADLELDREILKKAIAIFSGTKK